MKRRPPRSTRTDTLFPYTTLFRSLCGDFFPIRPSGLTQAKDVAFALIFHDPPFGKSWLDFALRIKCHQALPGCADHQLSSGALLRSEEHTSELQSLMRISYAVFCLKKKKTQTRPIHSTKTIM